MSQTDYFSDKFSKIAKRWGLSALQRRLTSNIDDLKFRDLTKEWFLKLIMTNSNFKNIVMTSFQ